MFLLIFLTKSMYLTIFLMEFITYYWNFYSIQLPRTVFVVFLVFTFLMWFLKKSRKWSYSSYPFRILKLEHVPNISLPTQGWGRRINFFWGLSALLGNMQAEDGVLAFFLKYQYVIWTVWKISILGWILSHVLKKVIEWLWTKDCKKWLFSKVLLD